MASATLRATRVFLPMESHRVNRVCGNRMANGMPGKPPPVPRSRTCAPPDRQLSKSAGCSSCRYRAMASECRTWWAYRLSMSLREITLIFSFHSRYRPSRAENCSSWCSVRKGKASRTKARKVSAFIVLRVFTVFSSRSISSAISLYCISYMSRFRATSRYRAGRRSM